MEIKREKLSGVLFDSELWIWNTTKSLTYVSAKAMAKTAMIAATAMLAKGTATTTYDKRERQWEFRWQCDLFDGVVIVIVCVRVSYCIFHFSSEKK